MSGVGDFRITGVDSVSRLRRRLDEAGRGDVRRKLNRELWAAAQPLRRDLQQAIRGNPIRGSGGGVSRRAAGHRPLRATIASAITIRTVGSGGVRIRVDKGRLPPDMRGLPARIDEGHWRHPVYGNRRRWASQYGRPWWGATIRRHEPRIRARVQRVLDDVKRLLGD